jgi:TatD DNase family protein
MTHSPTHLLTHSPIHRLIDSHAHLEMSDYDADRDTVIMRARDQGIENIITIGIGRKECEQALELARSYPFIYAALGLHPHNAKKGAARLYDFIREAAGTEKVVALGEMGLDFFKNWSPRQDQLRCFHEQLALARELKLPVIIHDRDAHDETVAILKEEQAHEVGGVIHCFSGDYRMAVQCMDMGFYISIPGTVTFKNASALHGVVQKLPLERLLIETDAPFLTPHPFRGKRNESAYVRYVAEKIAEIKDLPLEEVARVTTLNAKTLFSLP